MPHASCRTNIHSVLSKHKEVSMDPLDQIERMIQKYAAPLEAKATMLAAELDRLAQMVSDLEKRIDELEAEIESDSEVDDTVVDQALGETTLLDHLLSDHSMHPTSKPTHVSLTIDLSKNDPHKHQ